jgi:hypothetical protein
MGDHAKSLFDCNRPRALPNIVLIDMRIPADTGFDQRIRSDAMKKSAGFGLPWPEQPKVQQVQSAFPPSSGLPDP